MKKTTSIILVISLMNILFAIFPHAFQRGDVNGDKQINSSDALLILQYSIGQISNLPSYDAADINLDNIINSTDALEILRIVIGYNDINSMYSTEEYKGKKYLIFGDSYSDTGELSGRKFESWVPFFITQMSASSVDNRSYGGIAWGLCYSTKNGQTPYGYDIVQSAIDDKSVNPDAVIFFLGGNEYAKWYDEPETYFNMSLGELKELCSTKPIAAMIWCIKTVRNAYPNAKIFICTPIPVYATKIKLEDYDSTVIKREKQIKIAKELNVEIIDTFSSGIYAEKYFNPQTYHPNEAGAKLLSDFISKAVKNSFLKNK